MGIVYFQEPELVRPELVASWPGIGNIGLIAVDTLMRRYQAEELAEIEPWEFFYPRKAVIRAGLLEDLEFPASKFYHLKMDGKDIILFLGDEQPSHGGKPYAEGKKAFRMGNMVLDVAEKFGCRRIYTSGAAVALTHHQVKPKVWAVATDNHLLNNIKTDVKAVLMSEVIGREGGGNITGLNGLLLGLAKKRGLEAICLMGEIPDYLAEVPFPYPRATRSVLEILGKLLGIETDYRPLDEWALQVDEIVKGIYDKLPADIKEKIEQRKNIVEARSSEITEEDEDWIKEHIDEFFEKREGDERPS
jgi:uncharacterized protein